ncbi:Uncharacterized protein APZ42_022357 [Daphnia magna]|uniref:Uncharacterized protein n=1 Tax=Daphnia magna TaxID=35525 RepID=A0A164VEX8_9CRUS|nr:Uncharacterized protein APZ42_022357 [Daphnia magna]
MAAASPNPADFDDFSSAANRLKLAICPPNKDDGLPIRIQTDTTDFRGRYPARMTQD